MCSTIGVVITEVLQIQHESPLTRVLRIAVAVLRVVAAVLSGIPPLVTFSSLRLLKCCLLLDGVTVTLVDEAGIDNAVDAEPHALLTIFSHLFVAAIFDKDG